jgi:signal transduction histidine kinase
VRTRLVVAVSALATAALVGATRADPTHFVRNNPGANVAVQTTAALIAVLVVAVATGRFRHRRQLGDMLIMLALAQYAVGNVVFTALPLARRIPVTSSGTIWMGTLTRLAGAALLAAAAHVGPHQVDRRRGRHAGELVVVLSSAGLLGAALVAASLLPRVPAAAVLPAERLRDVAPALAGALVASAVLAAIAAAGFARSREGEPADELLVWFGASAVLMAGSSLATAASFVETYSVYVSTAELLKLGAALLLLGGVVRELRGSWAARAAVALSDQRRRIARDLHDGLAQELAFVVARSRVLARRADDDELWSVCWAAERALDESRRAIAALTSDDDEALHIALAHTAEAVAGRLGTAVTLELDERIEVPGETKEALLRIAREAITNAARHGAATRVHVRLSAEDTVRMRVSDNGRGFDAAATPAPGRLGLTGMRERAAALGGELTVSSRGAGGTDVEVVLP